MNDDPNLTAHGDEALEARITAWTLGEASAFEAAELERLCAERPELLVFRRRLLALHDALVEQSSSTSDEDWKLPAEKRAAIARLSGIHDQARAKSTKRSSRNAWIGIAACLAVSITLYFGKDAIVSKSPSRDSKEIVTYSAAKPKSEVAVMSSSRQESAETHAAVDALVAVDEDQMMGRVSRKPTAPSSSPVPAQREEALASSVSSSVAGNSPTPEEQGFLYQKAGSGGANSIDSSLVENEPLVRSNAAYAFEHQEAVLDPQTTDLRKAILNQTEKVEESRRILSAITRTKVINYSGDDSFFDRGSNVDENHAAQQMLDTYYQLEQEEMQLESQINSLQKYDSDQLMVYAAGLDLPDNSISNLYPRYQEAQRRVASLANSGLAKNDPTVLTAADQVEQIKKQLDEEVVNLQTTLQAKLDLSKERLKTIKSKTDADIQNAISRGLDQQDYLDAKEKFRKDQELLRQLKIKLSSSAQAGLAQQPKPDLARLIEEVTAAEEPYSTFSLNVSDVSFRMAQEVMAKGERPEAESIKPEQFYNAFDYGDPAPAAGEPIALAMNQAAHPVLPQRTLLRVSLKTAASGRGQGQPLRLTLVADQSGSMARPDRQEAMSKALDGLAGLLKADDQVSVVGFSRTPRLLGDSLPGDQAGQLPDLVNQAASEGGTNLEEALKLGSDIAMRNRADHAQNRIVMLTDGAANLGDAKPERLAAQITEMRQNGLAVDVAGIAADELNDELLAELARNGNGRYYVVGKDDNNDLAKRLAGAFRPAAENVKVQVRFNPERVLRYKLIGFEKDRLNKEDFRNDAVDAAELAAEEAGVAIYQLETNPEGSGEIGEVSVRFRDTTTGEMVERSWTIPHESMVPSLDRAEPAMQLAALATLTAEKLQGGPQSEAIEAEQLAPVVAQVRQQFRNDARVSELLTMFDQVTRK